MISEITKLFSVVCILNAGDPQPILRECLRLEDTRLLHIKCKPWDEALQLMLYMRNEYASFLEVVENLLDAEIDATEDAEKGKRSVITYIAGSLNSLGKLVQSMDENTFYMYLILQGIDVRRENAGVDFIEKCTLERMAAFLSNEKDYWKYTLLELQQNFNTEMANNAAFAEAFNKIRDGIRNRHPHLLPKLNSLFGLPEE